MPRGGRKTPTKSLRRYDEGSVKNQSKDIKSQPPTWKVAEKNPENGRQSAYVSNLARALVQEEKNLEALK